LRGISAAHGGRSHGKSRQRPSLALSGFYKPKAGSILSTWPSMRSIRRARYAAPAIVGTLATSAAMNASAFASHAEGFMVYPAVGLSFARNIEKSITYLADEPVRGELVSPVFSCFPLLSLQKQGNFLLLERFFVIIVSFSVVFPDGYWLQRQRLFLRKTGIFF
jgi:hypothetical protein